ncbi:tetratricopeptide repeat protein [Solwaraspora sp. WMMD792]|uniref:tetratricopeptide repeat protein n=1 Tax=Solwaraspora sp. WMMD792 TaxID=3016099 RepID=UPI002415E95B|nr:tetratricopeptide repeat protein [Solwaraspora sp. WMMD792]MDG4770973.1 tetratricopeptide repeat protein [Solwaraspora sp. WMMD792]
MTLPDIHLRGGASGHGQVFQAAGDQHITIYEQRPAYRVEQWQPQQPPDPRRLVDQPSMLLAANNQVVPFTALRDADRAELAAWRDDPARGVAVRLLHGPGGQGKTRLAAQFGADSVAAGWPVAVARHRSQLAADDPPEATEVTGRGLLVIVDYAERWPAEDLRDMFKDRLLRQGVPTRLLLLARPESTLWPLQHDLTTLGYAADVTALTPAADSPANRQRIFTEAADRFAYAYGIDDTSIRPPADLVTGDAYRQILVIHMAALVAVDAAARQRPAPTGDRDLSAYLLRREVDHWHKLHEQQASFVTTPQVLSRAVCTATLTRPLDYDDGLAALTTAGVCAPDAAGQVLTDHAVCYPPTEPDKALEPLYPDRLGEDFIALRLPGHGVAGSPADPWSSTAITRLITGTDPDGAGQPPWSAAALTMLVETAIRWPHVASRILSPLLRERPELAVAAGGTVLARIADVEALDIAVLEAIEPHLPQGQHVGLAIAKAAITKRLTSHRLGTADEPTRAWLLVTLSNWLSEAGRRDEALTATVEAADIYRRLAQANPAAYEPDLAMSLNNLGIRLSDLGRRDEALTATVEAADIYRRLAQANPAAYEPDLAMSLNNLSVDLSNLGRRDEALTATVEAVTIRRRLAQANPAAYEPDLATSLNNLGIRLSDLGRRDEALTATVEAVTIRRRLAQANPAAYEPDLATSLNNLGNRLSDLGRRDEALTATVEAVTIRRRLAQANPAAYEPDLATSLNNLGIRLSEAGRRDEALTATVEAVTIRRRLAQANPAAYEPDLATSLNNLGIRLSEAGRRDEALTATVEAADIYRRLAQANPAAYEPDLARSLNNLGNRLSDLGRRDEALTATVEAVTIRRRLAQANPAAYEPDLARSLNNLGIRLSEAGRRDEALTATVEAVTIRRRLAQANPAAYEPDLATSLNNLGIRLSEAGRRDEALTATVEAADIYRRLAQANPAAYEPDLAMSLNNLGNRLSDLGRRDEALTATVEAVTIRRRLAQANPAAYEPDLARSLWTEAWVRAAHQYELPEALTAATESVERYEKLFQQIPMAYVRDLAGALGTLADVLDGLGRGDEATAVRARRDALTDEP